MKFKNKYKQQSYEKFLEKRGGYDFDFTEDFDLEFNKLWKKGMKIARGEFIRKLASNEISKNTDILVQEFLSYNSSKIKTFYDIENENLSFDDRISKMNYQTISNRLINFFNIHGNEEYKGTKMIEYLNLFSIGLLDKEEFYDIIANFKKANPEKMTYSGKADPNDYGTK